MTTLAVPAGRKSRASHNRTVTRFCEEANISADDQLDLASFIVAAQYLGTDATTDQLSKVFSEMEEEVETKSNSDATTPAELAPKEVIKKLLQKVDDNYGTDLMGTGDVLPLSVLEASSSDDEFKSQINNEIFSQNPLSNVFSEDFEWQEKNIDGLIGMAQQDTTLLMARNLLAKTALTRHEIAEITGVEADLLKDYESDSYDTEEDDYYSDEDEDEYSTTKTATATVHEMKTSAATAYTTMTVPGPGNSKKSGNSSPSNAGITIASRAFGKTLVLTKTDIVTLEELISGGSEVCATRSDDSLKLLIKLKEALALTRGHVKRSKTLAKFNLLKKTKSLTMNITSGVSMSVSDVIGDTNMNNNNNNSTEINNNSNMLNTSIALAAAKSISMSVSMANDSAFKNLKFPAKFRVVVYPGALIKTGSDLESEEVGRVQIGTSVQVEEIDGRRCRISTPFEGWCSLHAADDRVILQKEGTKSKLMQKALHADRARQTKILILKSITTLNDATVTRILEKCDWNLRRAIESFYIAKYKTQEYLKQKEANESAASAVTATAVTPSGDNNSSNSNSNSNNGTTNSTSASASAAAAKKKGKNKGGWWKSWTTFTKNN